MNRRGVVFVVTVHGDPAALALRLADCAAAVRDPLLELAP